MKKTIIYTIFLSLFLVSCESWLDVNKSPNFSTSAAPNDLFAYAVVSHSANRVGGDSYFPMGFMNQNLSTGGNAGWGYAEDRYDISPYSLGNTWKLYFSTAGNNIQLAIRNAQNTDPVSTNIVAQCKIMMAELMYECTMIYGDVPYFQAWNEAYAYPEFDSQKDILEALLTELDDAIEMIDLSDPIVINEGDYFYHGDLTQWIKFANSVKLRILMAMYDKMPEVGTQIASLLNEDLIVDAADDFEFPFYDEPDNENMKFKLFDKYAGGINPWIFANSNVVDFMNAYNDPRRPLFFDEGPDAAEGEFIGVETATEATTTSSLMSMNLYRADAPEPILTSSEVLLYMAEIYTRGIGVSVDLATAATYFEDGVEAVMQYYDVPQGDIDNFIANDLPDISSMSATDARREIHIQQWLALCDRSLDAWIQSRRSGDEGSEVPNLQLPPGAPAGGLARRWIYPDDELTGNTNAPSELPHIYDKMWFDK